MFKKLKRQNRDKEFEWTKNDDKVLQAIEAGDIEKLQMTLAKKGTSPTKLDTEGKTALHFAAQKGQYPCLEVLLQLGANPRASDGQGK
ncbi:ankycorbin-like [Diadema antillarum]|uniref:ankycorbin-like n=1 Tax=Diadema antillarum TaxID=105358 RepID=UPI003A89F2EB